MTEQNTTNENKNMINLDATMRADIALKSPLLNYLYYNTCNWIDFRFNKPEKYVEYIVEITTSQEKIQTLIEKIESRLNKEYLEKISEYEHYTFWDNESVEECYYDLKRVFIEEENYYELEHERKDGSVVYFRLLTSQFNVNNEDYSESLVESVEVSKIIRRNTRKKLSPHKQGTDPKTALMSLLRDKNKTEG